MPRTVTRQVDATVTKIEYDPGASQITVHYVEETRDQSGVLINSVPKAAKIITTEITSTQKSTLNTIFTALIGAFRTAHYS